MRFEMMFPHQIRQAIVENWPVVLPLGVLEYHGEHLAVGLDTIVVIKLLEEVEQDMNLVLLPPFYYGAASYAVEAPEGTGSLHVDADQLYPFAQGMFTGLLRIGFRNIHFLCITRPRTLLPACRRIFRSNWGPDRRYSTSFRSKEAKDGGVKRKWLRITPSTKAAVIRSTGSRATPL